MMQTKQAITMLFGKGGIQAEITIPAGTRVSSASHGQWFVEDLSWLDRNSMTWHDANYYGIRLDTDQVESVSRHGYNPVAVNQAIESSNRSGQRIGAWEARAIHALLKGR